MSAEIRDDTADIADRGGIVGIHVPPDGGGEARPGPLDAIMFRIRDIVGPSDVRMAARLVLGTALILAAAWVAGTAIRVFLAAAGFRECTWVC